MTWRLQQKQYVVVQLPAHRAKLAAVSKQHQRLDSDGRTINA